MRAIISIFILLLVLPFSAYAQKIGYIDSEEIFQKFDDFKLARQKFDAEAADAERDIQKLWSSLDSLQQVREAGRFTWSSARLEEKDREISAMQEEIRSTTEKTFGPGGTIYKAQKELTQKAMDDIIIALKTVAEEEDYDFIFDAARGMIPFKKTKHNLTEAVIEKLQETSSGK